MRIVSIAKLALAWKHGKSISDWPANFMNLIQAKRGGFLLPDKYFVSSMAFQDWNTGKIHNPAIEEYPLDPSLLQAKTMCSMLAVKRITCLPFRYYFIAPSFAATAFGAIILRSSLTGLRMTPERYRLSQA